MYISDDKQSIECSYRYWQCMSDRVCCHWLVGRSLLILHVINVFLRFHVLNSASLSSIHNVRTTLTDHKMEPNDQDRGRKARIAVHDRHGSCSKISN
jgi:hypothetical protein